MYTGCLHAEFYTLSLVTALGKLQIAGMDKEKKSLYVSCCVVQDFKVCRKKQTAYSHNYFLLFAG
jgi:hypothetical protein